MAMILDGRAAALVWQNTLAKAVASRSHPSSLIIIQVGNLPASTVFIRRKLIFGEKIGVPVEHKQFPEGVTTDVLVAEIKKLNNDSRIDGIIVQLPLPLMVRRSAVIEAIAPEKDVDGLTAVNLKRVWERDPKAILPATARGILRLLDHYQIPLVGRRAVVVGRSSLVGKPIALALLNRDVTVTICHRQTTDLKKITRPADLLIVAAGSPKLITADHVSPKQIIVDVGITPMSNGKPARPGGGLSGDVDFQSVESIVGAISPVPGGVGPMTVAALFANLLDVSQRK